MSTKWRKYTKCVNKHVLFSYKKSTCSHVFSLIIAHFYPHYIIMAPHYIIVVKGLLTGTSNPPGDMRYDALVACNDGREG